MTCDISKLETLQIDESKVVGEAGIDPQLPA
jgi:hypothetical protein